MAQVASYILTFQGKEAANPKAAEGDLWVDTNVPAVVETDSVAATINE
jgi:cytochrome c oxidase cbb3-type subunit 3